MASGSPGQQWSALVMRGRGHLIRSRLVPSRSGGRQSRRRGQHRSNHSALTTTPELLLLYEQSPYYWALVLVGEGEGLDLEPVGVPQQAVEVEAEGVGGELGVEPGAQAREGMGVMTGEAELLG